MSNKNIYEVFDEFKACATKHDRINALVRNDSYALRQVLLGTFHPDIKFVITKIPEYKKEDAPAGMSYSNMTQSLDRIYLFMENNERVPAALTLERKEQLLIQILEALEEQESEVFTRILLKDQKIPHLTYKLVHEAFPDYYHNRKMLKSLAYDKRKFRPSITDVQKWFVILNEQLFGNKLKPFQKVQIKRHKHVHALFHYWPKKQNRESELTMNKIFDNEKVFVEILAHEMVHLFQYTYDEPLGHGPSFWVWSDNFKLKGLTLHKVA